MDMMDISATTRSAVLALVVAGTLAACGTRHVSRDIGDDGRAGEVIFPKVGDIVLKDGTFPNLDNVRAIGPGVTKDQLYALLGRPHFREGYAGVREWDYLFHLRQEDGGVTTCQYKVIFDKDYRGQSFHWAPASCVDVLEPEALPTAAMPAPAAAMGDEERFTLSMDVLFAFGKSGAGDILPEGSREIEDLADRIRSRGHSSVRVIGHADRIGGKAANQALSEQRADTIRRMLMERGVTSPISAEGRGAREMVKSCGEQPRSTLISCLAPNRRAEIIVGKVEG